MLTKLTMNFDLFNNKCPTRGQIENILHTAMELCFKDYYIIFNNLYETHASPKQMRFRVKKNIIFDLFNFVLNYLYF